MEGSVPQRFSVLETIVHWEGRLTIQQLETSLSISRSTAQKLVKEYRQTHPQHLSYDEHLKGYVPTSRFIPAYHDGGIGQYNGWLRARGENEFLIDLVDTPLRQLEAELIRPILYAIRKRQRIDVCYRSMKNPSGAERIISPHSLIFDGIRHHVRAFCELKQDFRDFVLSRFVLDESDNPPLLSGPASQTQEHDRAWNALLEFAIEPEPRLSHTQQQLIAYEYQMTNTGQNRWQRTLKCRAAVLQYLLRRLRLDLQQDLPEAQQIIISHKDREKLKPWLFSHGS
ncbi:WYL domain-containing protein [Bacterioplanoides sp.]|uniref:WYL domain-containing protein n=1 Tax=Bacterioplanoides sp. TaxID=2066072 RepID=UPI003B00E8CA